MNATVSENLINVIERIKRAARKVGRDPSEVTLVAAAKSVEIKKIKEAISGGVRAIGENYVQEAAEKIKKIKDSSVKWHLIGHLQKNKAKIAVNLFDVIESVDSLELAKELNKSGITAEAIHGNKSQNARERALSGFKSRSIRALIATDIAARGIDIDRLGYVINFELPEVPETYVHRIGRTGRAGAEGVALSFCDSEEKDYLKGITKLMKREIPKVDHPFNN